MNRFRLIVAAALAAFVLVDAPAPAATIVVYSGDGAGEGFSDPSPRAPVGGNPGTTLGQQRINAVEHAVAIWAGLLASSVPIEIQAAFNALECNDDGAVLGSAGPTSVHRDFTGAPLAGTWYTQALANRFARTDLNPSTADVSMTFNSSLGSGCAGGLDFYYGLDAAPPPGAIDLVSVVLHEVAHGLGFLSLINTSTGAPFAGAFDVYTLLLEQHSSGLTHDRLSTGQCSAVIRSGTDLHFIGENTRAGATAKTGGVDAGDHIRMYAPNPAEPGSSVSHFAVTVSPDELMEPSYTSAGHDVGLALALLEDLGWEDRCGDGVVDPGELCDDASGCCAADCSFAVSGTACEDGDTCTGGDTCDGAGVCRGGPGPDCDDGLPCTADTCGPAGACQHTVLANGTACSDGDACTAGDRCQAGACVATGPTDCNDGNLCTTDGCNPASGCTHAANALACNDGNACTWGDKCQGGTCTGAALLCDDGKSCTVDACSPASGCTFTARSGACSDGNACTTGDSCVGGICQPGAALNCADASVCTEDSCNPAIGCVHTPLSGPCNDGSVCTTGDTCQSGQCVGAPLDCSDGNPCTDDLCSPLAGCSNPDNQAACDDGNACTSGDICRDGACTSGPAPDCDDGNPCTDDSCELAEGCVHEDNADPCDDGLACTVNDRCGGGICDAAWDEEACALDPQLIYKARRATGSRETAVDSLVVIDPLLADVVAMKTTRGVGLAAAPTGALPRVPELALRCRKAHALLRATPSATTASVAASLGTFPVDVKKVASLCLPVPVATDGGEAGAVTGHERDAARCFKVKATAGPDTRGLLVDIDDALGRHSLKLGRLRELCAPAGLGGDPPATGSPWLACFQAKAVAGPGAAAAAVGGQGETDLAFDLLREQFLCLPSDVTLP